MNPENSVASSARPVSRIRRFLAWGGVAALAAPLGIILHELGHFVTAKAFGFPDLVFHYASVTDRAAEVGMPAWQQGVNAVAGPLVTLAIVLGCCVVARLRGPSPLAIAPAFAAGIRTFVVCGGFLIGRVLRPHQVPRGNFDELNAARHLGIPPEVVTGASFLLLVLAWAYLTRRIPRSERWMALGAITMGTVAGIVLYVQWIGPMLLP